MSRSGLSDVWMIQRKGKIVHSPKKRQPATIATVRDQLQPERIADELRRIAMTLEIATDGAVADSDGDEPARRMALVDRARQEISSLAAGLAGHTAPER